MYNKLYIYSIAFLALFLQHTHAQSSGMKINGIVLDQAFSLPLSFVNVVVQEVNSGTTTNDKGSFVLENIQTGHYHLILSHVGYHTKIIPIYCCKDTSLTIILYNNTIDIKDIVVEDEKNDYASQSSTSINLQTIEDNTHKNFSNLLENETGLYILRSGNSIAKPIVHGMYGNRLTILNNGIAQSGQQWGNDHAPEIDPLSVDKITILKGTSAIEYGSGNLGSVVLLEPDNIKKKSGLHGRVSYVYESNGNGHSFNTLLQQHTPVIAWRFNATLKKYGDRRSASYFLNNTGLEEANFSLQLEKSWKDKLFINFYASSFNTNLGVLRGAHISNLTDLESALSREVPFYTDSTFSYAIEAPNQNVSHHLVKLKTDYYLDANQSLSIVVAGQINNRKEYDIRRGGRTDRPAMSLLQYTIDAEIKYQRQFAQKWLLKIGTQSSYVGNRNNPETGISPLIPDYNTINTGLFATLSKSYKKITFNIGGRYDFEHQKVAAISRSIPRRIIRYSNNFHTGGAMVGLRYIPSDMHTLRFSSGVAMRNPGINELYSIGLHQGVSSIEEGDPTLQLEQSIKTTLEYSLKPHPNFSISALAYYQWFNDYIFLEPQNQFRLTIRGAFPLFLYKQTDANIYGFDIAAQYQIGKFLSGTIKYSFIKGDDLSASAPLVFMPPNTLFASLKFKTNKPLKVSANVTFGPLEIMLEDRLVFRQYHLLPEQDFTAAPQMYSLLGLDIANDVTIKNYKLRFFVNIENMLNTKYRDYLSRQRYFADDLGISVILGAKFKF